MRSIFLNQLWLNSHLKQIREKAGHRYTPKLNVNLPISEIFDGISRTKEFYTSIRTHCGELEREFSRISKQYRNSDIQKTYKIFSNDAIPLLEALKELKEYNTDPIDWKLISRLVKKANEDGWKLIDK